MVPVFFLYWFASVFVLCGMDCRASVRRYEELGVRGFVFCILSGEKRFIFGFCTRVVWDLRCLRVILPRVDLCCEILMQ